MALHAQGADIPNFIQASTPQGLRLAMLRNNAKHGMFFHYFDIQFVNGKWIAWFFQRIENADELLKPTEAKQ